MEEDDLTKTLKQLFVDNYTQMYIKTLDIRQVIWRIDGNEVMVGHNLWQQSILQSFGLSWPGGWNNKKSLNKPDTT